MCIRPSESLFFSSCNISCVTCLLPRLNFFLCLCCLLFFFFVFFWCEVSIFSLPACLLSLFLFSALYYLSVRPLITFHLMLSLLSCHFVCVPSLVSASLPLPPLIILTPPHHSVCVSVRSCASTLTPPDHI